MPKVLKSFPAGATLGLLVACLSLLPLSLAAQDPASSLAAQDPASAELPSIPKAPDEATITRTQTAAAWQAIDADPQVDAAVKDLVRPKFQQALEHLQKGEEYGKAAEGFRRSIQTAPVETQGRRDELATLPTPSQAAQVETVFEKTSDLQREIAARTAALDALTSEQATVNTELVAAREKRPTAISARIPEAESELVKVQTELQSPELAAGATSLGRIAERTLILAREARLVAELEMLKQEKLSLSAREDLLEARSDWLARRVANSTAALGTLKQQAQQRLEQEAQQADTVIESTKRAIPEDDLIAHGLVAEVDDLAGQFDEVVRHNANITTTQADTEERLVQLNEEFERLSRELDVEGAGSTLAQTAFDLQSRLADPKVFAVAPDPTLPGLESMRLASLRVDQQIRQQPLVEDRFSRRNSEPIDQLIQTRAELLEKLKSQYKRIIPAMITLEASRNQLRERNRSVHEEIADELMWIRSSAQLSLRDIASLPEGVAWLFSRNHWQELRAALEHAYAKDPMRFLGILFFVIILLALRPRMIRSLAATGHGVRRVSTDRYSHSWEALLWTVMLAAPLAILLAFFGWAFSLSPDPRAWMRGLMEGTPSASRIVFLLAFASELCRPEGLGNAHFGWRQSTLDAIRSTVFKFGIVYVPAGLIASSTLYGDAAPYADGLGRISLMLAKLWATFLLWQQIGGPDGLVARLRNTQPNRLLTRTRMLWYPLLLFAPLVFMLLAARGFVIASIKLSQGFVESLGVIFLAEIAYWMVLRGFSLRTRTLAVAERIERLRAARESALATSGEEPSESAEAIAVVQEDEQALDLKTIGQQTRRMVRSLLSVGLAVTLLYLWSSSFPVAPTLSAIQVPLTDGIDLLELLEALLILGVTWVMVRNIPGVLELSLLRDSTIDSGTRYAITTLCRYALAAIGAMAIFNVLNFDWTKFGWMAAALGVGLGFGLQEVITNFVCGLILLFERPVRLGDVVTIQGVTGTVTRIQMRATTITNWDRQELIVPNKSLITDTILNWTLSASITRIVINVGVAYGTNTEQARQILVQVANDHPLIMKEPPPMATFELFADSSLTLALRCFVPDLDYRLRTISELHTEIDLRFAEADIEIAFPQQDIHVRSGLDALIKPPRNRASNKPLNKPKIKS